MVIFYEKTFTSLCYFLASVIFTFVEFLLALRIILKLFGASSSASFVHWIYETSQPLLKPFLGAFPAPTLDGVFVIEFSALFASIIYALIGYFIMAIVSEITYRISKRS